MHACVLHAARDLRCEAVERQPFGSSDVRVAVKAGGICGSDLHYYFSGGVGDFRVREPLILGHEIAGEVVEVGSAVMHAAPGDRVVVNPSSPCARCRYCLEGRPNLCSDMRFLGSAARWPHVQGGLRSEMVASASQIIVVPPDTPYHIAAFAEPLAVALHAVNQAGPLIGRRVLVCGSGVIGALVALCARQAGALSVTTTDLADEPLALLRSIGAADETVNVRAAPERIEALAADRGSFDVSWEAVGHPAALETAIACTRPGGRVVQIGQTPPNLPPPSLNRLMSKELTLVGSFRFAEEFAWAVDYLVSKRIDVEPLYTGRFAPDRLDEAFHLAADRTRSMKVQIGF